MNARPAPRKSSLAAACPAFPMSAEGATSPARRKSSLAGANPVLPVSVVEATLTQTDQEKATPPKKATRSKATFYQSDESIARMRGAYLATVATE